MKNPLKCISYLVNLRIHYITNCKLFTDWLIKHSNMTISELKISRCGGGGGWGGGGGGEGSVKVHTWVSCYLHDHMTAI